MTYVHIILTGLVSLIPHPATNTWEVRLHDERSTPMHKMDHYPSIVVDHADLTLAPCPEEWRKLPNPAHTVLDGWRLSNGDINIKNSIKPVSPSSLLSVLSIEHGCTAAGGSSQCPIAKSFGGPSIKNPVAFGSLVTTEFESDMWQWNASAPEWIAEELCWNFEIDETELDIEFFHDGNKVELKLVAPAGGNIELRLQNTLHDDIFPLIGTGKPSYDPHVGLYFDESSDPPSPIPTLQKQTGGNKPALPVHAPHRLTDSEIGTRFDGLRVNCPPALWKG